jgi:alcohol dehydrogenase class IV
MSRVARSLRRACEQGDEPAGREDMACASLFGGLTLANGKLGAVHGFAAPFGGMFPGPHGAVCARLLPYVMSANIKALKQRAPEDPALHRYDEIAKILTGQSRAAAEEAITWVQELCCDLKVPPLTAWGLQKKDFPLLIRKASAASSMQGNPVKLTPEEMDEILMRAM